MTKRLFQLLSDIDFSKGSQASPVCPSHKSSIKMSIGEVILSGGKTELLGENLVYYHSVSQIPNMTGLGSNAVLRVEFVTAIFKTVFPIE
jgi:hypothetical protein